MENQDNIAAGDDSRTTQVSSLDRKVTITRFPTMGAKQKDIASRSLREFGSYLVTVNAASKARLPWFKLAIFGEKRTERGCLRSNNNMLACDGAEIDYDAGKLAINDAAEQLREADIAGLLYSTPTNTPDTPKWRIFAPFSTTLAPSGREQHVARLNGLFDGAIDGASFSASQAFYGGNIAGSPLISVIPVDGRFVDLAHDLDVGALDRRGKPWHAPERRPLRPPLHLPPSQAGTRDGIALLEAACQRVATANPGLQDNTLRDACWHVGRLVAEGRINQRLAEHALSRAAETMLNAPGRRPWCGAEIVKKIGKAMEGASWAK